MSADLIESVSGIIALGQIYTASRIAQCTLLTVLEARVIVVSVLRYSQPQDTWLGHAQRMRMLARTAVDTPKLVDRVFHVTIYTERTYKGIHNADAEKDLSLHRLRVLSCGNHTYWLYTSPAL